MLTSRGAWCIFGLRGHSGLDTRCAALTMNTSPACTATPLLLTTSPQPKQSSTAESRSYCMAEQLSLPGARLRDNALALLEVTRPDYIKAARKMMQAECERKGFVTSDDLHRIYPPPEQFDPRVVGSVFCKSQFEPFAYTPTKRPQAHARPIRKCRLRRTR